MHRSPLPAGCPKPSKVWSQEPLRGLLPAYFPVFSQAPVPRCVGICDDDDYLKVYQQNPRQVHWIFQDCLRILTLVEVRFAQLPVPDSNLPHRETWWLVAVEIGYQPATFQTLIRKHRFFAIDTTYLMGKLQTRKRNKDDVARSLFRFPSTARFGAAFTKVPHFKWDLMEAVRHLWNRPEATIHVPPEKTCLVTAVGTGKAFNVSRKPYELLLWRVRCAYLLIMTAHYQGHLYAMRVETGSPGQRSANGVLVWMNIIILIFKAQAY
ncbi:phenylhydantoinase [Anopheles sinensis]|uniref:Phenylhydantoinase n=1 Tax=Anopheles sinensis TaxID=74873 RepID=A0A084VQP7_ANOSI|nr:phenylhydantoinase [Anopheles sinensis]